MVFVITVVCNATKTPVVNSAIASKATLLKPNQLPVPKEKFQQAFGLSWEEALQKASKLFEISPESTINIVLLQGLVFNAMDACKHLGIDAEGLDKAWAPAKKVKFGGGFYCGLVEVSD